MCVKFRKVELHYIFVFEFVRSRVTARLHHMIVFELVMQRKKTEGISHKWLAASFCWTKFPKIETIFSAKFVRKFAPIFLCLPGMWRGVHPKFHQIFQPERFQVPNQISPRNFPTRFCSLVDVSDILYIFFPRGRGRGSSRRQEGRGGGWFSIEIPRRGASQERGGVGGDGLGGCLRGISGGGLFFFSSGPKCPPRQAWPA